MRDEWCRYVWTPQAHAGFGREYTARREREEQILKMNMAEVDDIDDQLSVVDEDFALSNNTKKRKASAKDEGPA